MRSRALAAGIAAYGLWGLVPLYFKLLGEVGSFEIIVHRVLWSVLFLGLVLALRNPRRLLRHVRIRPRVALALAVSGALIVTNWLVFVHAVNTGRVLSTSLGYFINPLVSVLLGTLVLGERLDRWQWLAVALAAAGTGWLAWRLGEPPWLALALALSFGLYGLVRKLTDVGPMVGLFWETLLIAPFAAFWLLWLADPQTLHFGTGGAVVKLLLAGTGLVTVVPLLLFAIAARGLPLSTVGLLQYLAPSISFCLAVFLYREPFGFDHAVAFALIWTALAIYSAVLWRQRRRPVADPMRPE